MAPGWNGLAFIFSLVSTACYTIACIAESTSPKVVQRFSWWTVTSSEIGQYNALGLSGEYLHEIGYSGFQSYGGYSDDDHHTSCVAAGSMTYVLTIAAAVSAFLFTCVSFNRIVKDHPDTRVAAAIFGCMEFAFGIAALSEFYIYCVKIILQEIEDIDDFVTYTYTPALHTGAILMIIGIILSFFSMLIAFIPQEEIF